MERREVIVNNDKGIHVRVASILVKEACEFKSDIYIEKDFKKANCKSIMSIMILGITNGSKIIVFAVGEDEKLAVDKICALLEYNFEDD